MWPLPTTNGRILLMTQAKHKRTVPAVLEWYIAGKNGSRRPRHEKWSRTKTIATLASGVQPQEFSDFRSRCSRWRSSQCSISATRDTEDQLVSGTFLLPLGVLAGAAQNLPSVWVNSPVVRSLFQDNLPSPIVISVSLSGMATTALRMDLRF